MRLRALIGAVLLCCAGAAAALPPKFSARYEVRMAGLTLGEALVKYQQLGSDGYRYSSVTRPLGIAALFYNTEIKESSEGQITGQGFRPDRYDYTRVGNKARDASLVFDWGNLKVTNTVAGKTWDMEIPKDALDRMVSQLQLMRDLARDDNDLTYRIADGGKLREFTLEYAGRERVSTPYGPMETIKVTRQEKNGRRATTFWCAPALQYLAVRIEHREKGDNYRMTLEELDGFPLPAGSTPIEKGVTMPPVVNEK